MTTTKRKRHTPSRRVRKVREGERMLAGGNDLAEVLRHLKISESTWHRWRRTYAGTNAADVRRHKEFEAENARLKKLLAEGELDKAILAEPVRELSHTDRSQPVKHHPEQHKVCRQTVWEDSWERPLQSVDKRPLTW